MSIWLLITNPYAYDRGMFQAISEAKKSQTSLVVVFFISKNTMGEMMHELGEMGWLGASSFRTLQTSMLQGYRALATDVIKRVKRKAKGVELIIEGVVEEPSIQAYIKRILKQEAIKIIIAGSRSFTPNLDRLPDRVEYVEDR